MNFLNISFNILSLRIPAEVVSELASIERLTQKIFENLIKNNSCP